MAESDGAGAAGSAGVADAGAQGGEATPEAQAWLTSVPEALRGHEVFKPMKEAGEVYSRLTELSDQSKDMLKIPGEGSTEEEKSAYYTRLGRPETSEGYTYQKPTDWPAEAPYNDALLTSMKAKAHAIGMNEAQFNALASAFDESEKGFFLEINKTIEENKTKQLEALKALWPGDQFEKKSAETFESIKLFTDKAVIPEGLKEGFAQFMENNKHDPSFNWMWSEVFKLVGDDFFLTGGQKNLGSTDIAGQMFSRSMPDK